MAVFWGVTLKKAFLNPLNRGEKGANTGKKDLNPVQSVSPKKKNMQ